MKAPLNAVVLAAGLGTRLRPLTLSVPKPMVPAGGKPLVQHAIERLAEFGVGRVFLNLHAFPEQITSHFGDGRNFGIKIEYLNEPSLLGSAGTVRELGAALRGGGDFLVWYGDNYCEIELSPFWAFHQEHNRLMTLAVHFRDDVQSSGVVEQDAAGLIKRFVEKPSDATHGGWVNGGIYGCSERVLDLLPHQPALDFGRDVIPRLLAAGEPLVAYRLREFLLGIDTPESYHRLQTRLEGQRA